MYPVLHAPKPVNKIIVLFILIFLKYKIYLIINVLYLEVGIARAESWMAGVQFLAWAKEFSLPHTIQTGSEAHPASYTMGASCSYPKCKAAEA
jgi:hypothetical protein